VKTLCRRQGVEWELGAVIRKPGYGRTVTLLVPWIPDWISPNLARRFGRKGRLAWMGVLEFEMISE